MIIPWRTTILLLEVPEMSIESLDESQISRWSLQVLITMLNIFTEAAIPVSEVRATIYSTKTAVNRGQIERKGSFRGHPKQGGGAVFS